jgi:predicted glycosyltransferase
MRVLVDILHPAHVHVFGALAKELTTRGHEVRFTLREKECARDLLDQRGLTYQTLSTQQQGAGLAREFLERNARLWGVVSQFRPHFLAGIMGPSITVVGRLRRLLARDRARIAVFYDTEIARLTNAVVYPLADYVCTPDCYQEPVHGNHITYPGYHELAYLHPNRFTPDPEVVRRAGIDPGSRYAIVRFVSYKATHDLGTVGLRDEQKVALVRALAAHGNVYVSSEASLPPELEPYRLRITVSDIHHIIAHARLLAGESATMASEAAVLGVPAVYISPLGRGYTDDEEIRYQLVRNFTGPRFDDDWLATAVGLFSSDEEPRRAADARARLLHEKADVTSWIADFFEREYRTHFPNGAAR